MKRAMAQLIYMHFQGLFHSVTSRFQLLYKKQYALVWEQPYHLNHQLKVLYQIEF